MFAPTARRAAAQASAYAPNGSLAAGFGVAVGSGALFLFGEVPRVRNDILRKLPFLDTYYDRSIAPEDNPF